MTTALQIAALVAAQAALQATTQWGFSAIRPGHPQGEEPLRQIVERVCAAPGGLVCVAVSAGGEVLPAEVTAQCGHRHGSA